MSPDRTPHARYRPSAFTLIELLVTIGIIGILIALVITVIPKVKRAVYGAETQAQMAAIANAIQQYYGDFKAYPGPFANNQLNISAYGGSVVPYVLDPNNGNTQVPFAFNAQCDTTASALQISGSENLVLGLLGGLELTYNANGTINTFDFNPSLLFPDGVTPTPRGAASLNAANPRRSQAYIQVKAGDLSNSKTMGATSLSTVFTDNASRVAKDTPIPEFVDKFSEPMPILYLRANVGGMAIAALGGKDDVPAALTQKNADGTLSPVIAQYDLAQVTGYTSTSIGTAPNDSKRNHHGLQGLGQMTDSIQSGWANLPGLNGLAYLKDPNNPGTSNTPDYSVSPAATGNARQKDGFILISAGPDGVYGTPDDIIYPGGTISQ